MALIIPDGFAQVTIPIRHVLMAREAVVTFGVEWNPAGTAEAALDRIFSDWFETMGGVIDEACTQGPARASVGTSTDEHIQVEGTDTGGSSRSVEEAPPNVAMLIQKRTARGGRRGRGRMFVPWALDEGQVSGVGGITVGQVNLAQTAADAFLFNLLTIDGDGGPFTMHILHVSGGSTTPGPPDPVTALVVDNVVSTQRRRLGR